MTSHELAKMLLEQADQPIKTWDPDLDEWAEVTGFTYDGDNPCVQLYTDVNDLEPDEEEEP